VVMMAVMSKSKKPLATALDPLKATTGIGHVVNDYINLMWCRWAVDQNACFPDLVRSHMAFSYFLPHRAFTDFFMKETRWEPKDWTSGDHDVLAVDYSDYPRGSYKHKEWDEWCEHMNTHLFHINYHRGKAKKKFDAQPVVKQLFPEFEENWRHFVGSLRGDFPNLFRQAINRRRHEFPTITLYP